MLGMGSNWRTSTIRRTTQRCPASSHESCSTCHFFLLSRGWLHFNLHLNCATSTSTAIETYCAQPRPTVPGRVHAAVLINTDWVPPSTLRSLPRTSELAVERRIDCAWVVPESGQDHGQRCGVDALCGGGADTAIAWPPL
jgi:hypothetical protein